MRTQLEETVLEYVGELDRAPTRARAMKRAAARVRDRDALLAERRDAKRAELSMLDDEQLVHRAREGALPLDLPGWWRARMIERIAQHESRNELCVELLTAELDAADDAAEQAESDAASIATAETEPPPGTVCGDCRDAPGTIGGWTCNGQPILVCERCDTGLRIEAAHDRMLRGDHEPAPGVQ